MMEEEKYTATAIRERKIKELPPYQSKEWFDIPNKEKIEIIAYGMPFSLSIDYAANTIRSGLDYSRAGQGTYEEGLEVIVLAMHQQLGSLYKDRLERVMTSTACVIFPDPLNKE